MRSPFSLSVGNELVRIICSNWSGIDESRMKQSITVYCYAFFSLILCVVAERGLFQKQRKAELIHGAWVTAADDFWRQAVVPGVMWVLYPSRTALPYVFTQEAEPVSILASHSNSRSSIKIRTDINQFSTRLITG